MENNNLEKQTNESNPKSTRKIAIWCCVAAAICLVIATALVMHFRNSDGTNVSDTDTSASGRDSDQLQGSETEAETEAPKPEFEISEAGVLTSYNGDDETVVIPDNVISIGADAFGASPRADAITTVKLGKSVEDIDVQAFVSLTNLENVEVPEENGNYISEDGVLIKADNSVFFCMPSIIKADYDMFDVFFDVISNKIDGTGESKLVSGGMVAEVEIEYAKPDDPLDRKYYLYCNSFSANGQRKVFSEPQYDRYLEGVDGARGNRAFETDGVSVFSNVNYIGFGDTWFFTEKDIVSTNITDPGFAGQYIDDKEWYNYSVITFRKGENSSLKYIRKPYKYCTIGGEPGAPQCWTSFDELVQEEGTVKIENDEIIYYPEASWTFRDKGCEKYVDDMLNRYENLECNTVEEYLAHNAEIYEKSK